MLYDPFSDFLLAYIQGSSTAEPVDELVVDNGNAYILDSSTAEQLIKAWRINLLEKGNGVEKSGRSQRKARPTIRVKSTNIEI